MKQFLMTLIGIVVLATGLRADAGFSIRRRTAPTELRFSGTANLGSFRLVRASWRSTYYDSLNQQYAIRFSDFITDATVISVRDGGKRWEESDRYVSLLLYDSNRVMTDSIGFYMKKHNLFLDIRGVKDGKLQYTLSKKKAVYEYGVTGLESSYGDFLASRWIFIAVSLAGFAWLTLLFYRRRKKMITA